MTCCFAQSRHIRSDWSSAASFSPPLYQGFLRLPCGLLHLSPRCRATRCCCPGQTLPSGLLQLSSPSLLLALSSLLPLVLLNGLLSADLIMASLLYNRIPLQMECNFPALCLGLLLSPSPSPLDSASLVSLCMLGPCLPRRPLSSARLARAQPRQGPQSLPSPPLGASTPGEPHILSIN